MFDKLFNAFFRGLRYNNFFLLLKKCADKYIFYFYWYCKYVLIWGESWKIWWIFFFIEKMPWMNGKKVMGVWFLNFLCAWFFIIKNSGGMAQRNFNVQFVMGFFGSKETASNLCLKKFFPKIQSFSRHFIHHFKKSPWSNRKKILIKTSKIVFSVNK